MNYIELINNFWALNKEYSFTPNEKAVYFALLNKCNELGWKNPFNQSNGYLALDACMSESAMQKARNTLQQKGLITFTSGDGRRNNTVYRLIICNKGSFKKDLSSTLSDTLSSTLSDTLSGEKGTDNNKLKTKQKKTKHVPGDESPAKEKSLLYWKSFVDVWDEWYLEKFKNKYVYQKQDFAHLKKIYQFLEKRAADKKFEFTEENLLAAFKFYLKKAWEKDQWLRNNFSLANLLSQFNQIANGTAKTDHKNGKQPTGANVSTGSILSKINSMPD